MAQRTRVVHGIISPRGERVPAITCRTVLRFAALCLRCRRHDTLRARAIDTGPSMPREKGEIPPPVPTADPHPARINGTGREFDRRNVDGAMVDKPPDVPSTPKGFGDTHRQTPAHEGLLPKQQKKIEEGLPWPEDWQEANATKRNVELSGVKWHHDRVRCVC
jgi:hypothetical protein